MSSEEKEYPEICIYMGQSIDGKGSGEMFLAPESKPGIKYYFENEYSFGYKSIIMGRNTFQEGMKGKKIDYTGISTDNIEKKDFLSELRKKTDYYYISLDKNGNTKIF